MDRKKAFFEILKHELAPGLREIGFKGSGQNFRRTDDEVINVVNIQVNKYGGSCAVNLGLHLSFLPLSWNARLPDPRTIKEPDCEFRMRLAPRYRLDYWWKYDGLLGTPEKKARHLIETYFKHGEPRFVEYNTVEQIAAMFTIDDFGNRDCLAVFGDVTLQRGALAMARIHNHLGNRSRAAEFATYGLEHVGKAVALRAQYEEILRAI